jgi:hypothetical protein
MHGSACPIEPGMAAITPARTAHAPWTRLSLVAGLLVAAFALTMGTGAGPEVSDHGLCVGAIAVAVACLLRARSLTGRARLGLGTHRRRGVQLGGTPGPARVTSSSRTPGRY